MNMLTTCLQDGLFAAVASVGFAAISRPTRVIILVAALLAAIGHMGRFLLMQAQVGIASASLCAAALIALCSMPFARKLHIPAEMFVFPALLPMIPGMFAYKAILATLRFLNQPDIVPDYALLAQIAYNSMNALFIMLALGIGASVPLLLLRRESPLGKAVRHLRCSTRALASRHKPRH